MKILIILFICCCVLIFKSRKFKSPYKLIMVFGKKGSGKTTYLVQQGLYYQKRGYVVYTNITGINVPGFRYIDISDLGAFGPVENSVLLIDEAGTVFDNRAFKSFKPETRDFFKLQRHYRVVCILASQSFDVDKKLRDLTDSMVLIQSLVPGYGLLRPIRRKITLTEASSFGESRIADNLKFAPIFSWRFLSYKKYHKYFDSFVAPKLPEISYKSNTPE